jgi:transposase InsO family protein
VNVYPFIEAERAGRRSVARACALLKVSRAACCQHQAGPSQRDQQDAELTTEITAVHQDSRGRYGAPRVHAELGRKGHRHGRKRVARLMRAAGIRGRAPKRWKKTTVADPAGAARADRIRRDFTADAAKINSRWCGDITYIGTWQGWLYLATVTGIASRRVVGYAIADHLRTELVADALANAVATRNPAAGVIFHADRGCQPTSAAFAALAGDCAITLSQGRTGQCWDKACVSYCTSWRGLGGNSVSDGASLPGDQPRVAGCGRLEEADVLVVGLVRGQQPGAVPVLDRRLVHAEAHGEFVDGQQAAGAQPFGVAGHVVRAA